MEFIPGNARLVLDAATYQKEKNDLKAAVQKALLVEYKELLTISESGRSSWSTGAVNIRRELKAAFPKVKFRVKSNTYSGGTSIDVYWIDGPTTEEVKKITAKYEHGSFDGMTDSYNYDYDNQFPGVFGGAKYVMENRTISEKAYNDVAKTLGYNEAVFEPSQGGYSGVAYNTSEHLKREAWKRTFDSKETIGY